MTPEEIEAAHAAVQQFAPMMTQLIEGNIPAWVIVLTGVGCFALIVYLFDFLAELVRERAS